jgi:hypothetical protein
MVRSAQTRGKLSGMRFPADVTGAVGKITELRSFSRKRKRLRLTEQKATQAVVDAVAHRPLCRGAH